MPQTAHSAASADPTTPQSGVRTQSSTSNSPSTPAYPSPQEVLKAYPKEPERVAALVILRDVIWASDPRLPAPNDVTEGARNAARQLLGNTSDAWRQQQGDAYNKAIKQVQASEGQTNFTRAQTILIYHGGTGSDRDDHAYDFHEQLYTKFVPALVTGMRAEEAAIGARGQARIIRAVFGLGGLVILLLMLLIMLIAPWRVVARRGKHRAIATGPADSSRDPLTLPESLRVVQLPRLEYEVGLQSGMVIDEKTWSETHVSVSTSGGNTNMVHVHSSSTVVQKDRIWLLDPKQQQLAWTFSGGEFLTRQGHIVSILTLPQKNNRCSALIAYNHVTDNFKVYESEYNSAHRLKVFGLWFMTMVIALAGGALAWFCLTHAMTTQQQLKTMNLAFFVWLGVAAVASGLYVGVIKLFYQIRRKRAFRQKYLPAYRQFFEHSTPELMKHFGEIT